jgi:NAD(P)-dependent dehydrogenase (short-subunit alcohol dehydrogenase family)
MNHSSIHDREVIVAGGSGGLGAESVKMLASEGARVIAGYASNRGRAEELRSVATLVQADITKEQDRAHLLRTAHSLYGLVIFSGMAARSEDLTEESLAVNYLGPIRLAREAAARMKEAKTHGAIILVSTMQAMAVFPNSTAYAAPKAALVHAAQILAKECRGTTNIRVNVVCPGVIEAGIALTTIKQGKYERYLKEDAISRYGHSADVARAVRLFLEPDNYITGQVLVIDGGLTL